MRHESGKGPSAIRLLLNYCRPSLYSVAFVAAVTGIVPMAGAEDPLREWMSANIEQWDSDQREEACQELEAILDGVSPSLTPQERDALIQATPFFLESVGVANGVSHEVEVELLREVYQSAVQDYVTRVPMSEQMKEEADAQREELFEFIKGEVSRVTDSVNDEQAADAVWSFVENLELRWDQAAANPLLPYFKQTLADSEFLRIQNDIRQRVDNYLAAPASSDDDSTDPPDIVGGMPAPVLVLVRGLFELETESFMRPRSDSELAIEMELYEASAAKAQEQGRKALAEMQARREASDAAMKLHMAGSKASHALRGHVNGKESPEDYSALTAEGIAIGKDPRVVGSPEERSEGLPAVAYVLIASFSAALCAVVVLLIRRAVLRRLPLN